MFPKMFVVERLAWQLVLYKEIVFVIATVVGQDGIPELVEVSSADNTMSKASEIWHSIRVYYTYTIIGMFADPQ